MLTSGAAHQRLSSRAPGCCPPPSLPPLFLAPRQLKREWEDTPLALPCHPLQAGGGAPSHSLPSLSLGVYGQGV